MGLIEACFPAPSPRASAGPSGMTRNRARDAFVSRGLMAFVERGRPATPLRRRERGSCHSIRGELEASTIEVVIGATTIRVPAA